MEYLNKIIDWVRQEVDKAGAQGVIVGLSGGIDSALVAYIAQQSFPKNHLVLLLPICKERKEDLEDGLLLVNQLNLNYQVIDLAQEYNQLVNKLGKTNNLVLGNLQSRLRMSIIYAQGQLNNYLVLGTDNWSEYRLGYFTKWGDGGCDLLPIVHLYKSEVYQYGKKLNFPESILNKKPSAGFFQDQNDEEDLGFTYDDFEQYEKGKLSNCNKIKLIENQIKKTEHKRKPIPMACKKGV